METPYEKLLRQSAQFSALVGRLPKFPIGARVRLVRSGDSNIKCGSRGTIVTHDLAPWVDFDRQISTKEQDNLDEIPGWHSGHMENVMETQLNWVAD